SSTRSSPSAIEPSRPRVQNGNPSAFDRVARTRDPQARGVDRVDPREQHVAKARLELAHQIAAQAAGPAPPEHARVRAEKPREQVPGEEKRDQDGERCRYRPEDGPIDPCGWRGQQEERRYLESG